MAHHARTFGDNNIMNVLTRVGRKNGEADEILMMYVL
jgi:hypothetical protein